MYSYEIQRIPTRIEGLDRLLGGGLDIIRKPFTIVLRGGVGTDSTQFCLQLLYGIALSLNDAERNFPQSYKSTPVYVSSCHKKADIENILTDTFLSSCLYAMTKKIIENSYEESDMSSVTRILFDTSRILSTQNAIQSNITIPVREIESNPDRLIAESALYYSSRTGALHYRTVDSVANNLNIIYPRKYSSINQYAKFSQTANSILYRLLNIQALNVKILPQVEFSNVVKTFLLAYEIDDTKDFSMDSIRELIRQLKLKSQISILVVDDDTKIPANDADIIIDLYNKAYGGYVFHYLNISQNSHQYSALGEHQYKKRDFGIEVFPSIHTYSKKKKNFHRSQLYTHSSVIEDTFPQYIERKTRHNQEEATYEDYVNNKEKYILENMKSLHPSDEGQFISYDILQKIFITSKDYKGYDDFNENETGLVTAIIGNGNTYKRYLTIGCAFSAAVNNQDTLIVVLSKEKHLIQKRMSCPALMLSNRYKTRCIQCYKHFHFMSIYPEYITRDEFVYMLNQHIKLAYDKRKERYVRRIIIDDLQILDYSFPFLKGDSDFLTAVMNICRENGIDLYILCDKQAKSRDALKALADNVVCTEKNDKGLPKIYVERCSGYYNPPSKMYCGIIKNIKKLFECNMQYNDQGHEDYELSINPVYVDDRSLPNMDEFWQL